MLNLIVRLQTLHAVIIKIELRQTPKIMENQIDENKSRNYKFSFHNFIHFISDLMRPFYNFII